MASREDGSSATASAIHSAHAAYAIQTTTSSWNWRQRQMYGLCEFLTTQRETLIQSLCKDAEGRQRQYEQELALVLEDIARHYVYLSKSSFPLESPPGPQRGLKQQFLPVGVSMVVVDSANPIRFVFSTLATNIAVGNTVVVANGFSQKSTAFWMTLGREAPNYLDSAAIHILERFEDDVAALRDADLIAIFADDSEPYHEILSRPDTNARIFKTTPGASLVVVDEGLKSHDDIAKQVLDSFSFRGIRPEAVSAVFLRQDEIARFQQSFNDVATDTRVANEKSTSAELKLDGSGPFSPGVFRIDLATLVRSDARLRGLQAALDQGRRAGVLLVVVYRTIDHVIDALRKLPTHPAYLAFLAPYSKANSDYFEKWTTSDVYSLGSVITVAPHCSSSQPSDVVFPPELFTISRVSVTMPNAKPQPLLEEVVQRVSGIVKRPGEAPNQTDDFFIYMARQARRVGMLCAATLCATGAYFLYMRRLPK
ncbi:hypothetical protein Z517_06968 [Fonsecaea pedrosoi CBS 271.37]|uniref:Aldehyde dehydrogenase domain-containing protein n=1 Tax=Fonsecaea pedrosoi CBS 271.37 TaxID=1442368 RepID=A0A0D2GHT6_9EURO|nr:uncharacterized protein Z517_06968 [Fonsecaea pedrosoi CBS 271.37]KIW80353.1 hypothetical protein Z517_06968 [Fonsecaea pedrosoi CBS 271.37]